MQNTLSRYENLIVMGHFNINFKKPRFHFIARFCRKLVLTKISQNIAAIF